MSIILTIILGYIGLVIFVMLLTWWAYKRSQKNIPIGLQAYPSTIYPNTPDLDMTDCSVDVILVDERGVLFIGFYSYDMPGWVFNHDLFKPKGDFVWMYKPSQFKL